MKESKIFTERNLTEKVHYVYRVTIDDKYYIGKRSGFLNDLETGVYKTSSRIIQEKLKNGYHFSKIKILQVFSTSEEALEYEKKILTRLNAKRNPKFLNRTNGDKNFYNKQHTEETKEKISKTKKAQFDENTERGKKLREINSEKSKAQFDKNTEYGRKQREIQSEIKKVRFDENTEEGRKRREDMSKTKKTQYDINTEQGRQLREKISETLIQKRKDTCILGELMFDEDFIKENFLITDDKNNPRFLSSVYSKLSGYSMSHIAKEKRKGKLSFLYGIKSISITEELDNSKIREIEYSLKEA